MYLLGMMWAYHAEPPDLDMARHWFERAADNGHTGAMTALGDLYARVMQPPDFAAARHWYERAIAAGDRGAMHNLEVLYEDLADTPAGWGVRPPSDQEMDAMHDWFYGPGAVLDEAFRTLDSAIDEIMDGTSKWRDETSLRALNAQLSRLVTDALSGGLPTPDPDLTRALQGVLDDADEFRWTDRELATPLTPEQRETLLSRTSSLGASIAAAGSIFVRDLEILEAAGRD